MSTNYRAFKVSTVSSSVALGPGSNYPNTWGIMKGQNNPSGSVNLQGGGSLDFKDIEQHQIFPCYPQSVSVSSGTIIILQ